jgi:hypothetical protein
MQKVKQQSIESARKPTQRSARATLTPTKFNIGDYVTVKNTRRPDKTATLWRGPYQIVDKTDHEFQLYNPITDRTFNIHSAEIEHFNFRETATEQTQHDLITLDDDGVFIDSIVAHRLIPHKDPNNITSYESPSSGTIFLTKKTNGSAIAVALILKLWMTTQSPTRHSLSRRVNRCKRVRPQSCIIPT